MVEKFSSDHSSAPQTGLVSKRSDKDDHLLLLDYNLQLQKNLWTNQPTKATRPMNHPGIARITSTAPQTTFLFTFIFCSNPTKGDKKTIP